MHLEVSVDDGRVAVVQETNGPRELYRELQHPLYRRAPRAPLAGIAGDVASVFVLYVLVKQVT